MEKQENNFLKQVLPDPTNNFILALLETHGTPAVWHMHFLLAAAILQIPFRGLHHTMVH